MYMYIYTFMHAHTPAHTRVFYINNAYVIVYGLNVLCKKTILYL